MMEDHEFCDSCPGCRPAMLNAQNGEPLPDDHPDMKLVNQVWDTQTTYAQRRAFIEVTLKNSRDPFNLKLYRQVGEKVMAALKAAASP